MICNFWTRVFCRRVCLIYRHNFIKWKTLKQIDFPNLCICFLFFNQCTIFSLKWFITGDIITCSAFYRDSNIHHHMLKHNIVQVEDEILYNSRDNASRLAKKNDKKRYQLKENIFTLCVFLLFIKGPHQGPFS